MSSHQQSQKQVSFAVDHRTRNLLHHYLLDAAGMIRNQSFKSIRAPVLWPQDEGYHVFGLPPEWAHLLPEIRDLDVLLQFAQHKVSYRIVPKSNSSPSDTAGRNDTSKPQYTANDEIPF